MCVRAHWGVWTSVVFQLTDDGRRKLIHSIRCRTQEAHQPPSASDHGHTRLLLSCTLALLLPAVNLHDHSLSSIRRNCVLSSSNPCVCCPSIYKTNDCKYVYQYVYYVYVYVYRYVTTRSTSVLVLFAIHLPRHAPGCLCGKWQ
jgi:hypothetical protein